MVVLTTSALFSGHGPPLVVRDQQVDAPTGPIVAEAVKIVFGLSGCAKISTALSAEVLETGKVMVIPAGVECSVFPFGHARTVTIYLHPEYLSDQVRWLPAAHPLVHRLHKAIDGACGLQLLQLTASSVQDLTPLLMQLARASAGASKFALLAGVAQVFDALGRFAGAPSASVEMAAAMPRREVVAALSLLRSDMRAPWRIETLAQAISLSPSQLTRLFRTHVGVSPGAFLNQLRADRMAELLASTSLTVGEAGTAVGWPDLAVASRSFKQRYGVAPSAYASFHRSPARFLSKTPLRTR